MRKPTRGYTVDEYLSLERIAEDRHLYLDGAITAIAGEGGQHGDIKANIVASIGNQLRGSPCRARTTATRVCSSPIPQAGETRRGLFSYPDVLVICGEPEYHDGFRDVVLNPQVIVEVLSESTERFDRGEKFTRL